jgi:uncharacterized protein (TIGR00369 family)
MTSTDHHRRLERMYLAAPCNLIYRPQITIGDRECEIRIDIHDELFHAGRAVHGSVYFKLMDDASFFAVNSLVDDVFVLTASFSVYLVRPVTEGVMVATGRVVSASRTLFTAEATVRDGRDRLVGHGSGSFMRSRTALVDAMGYADDR